MNRLGRRAAMARPPTRSGSDVTLLSLNPPGVQIYEPVTAATALVESVNDEILPPLLILLVRISGGALGVVIRERANLANRALDVRRSPPQGSSGHSP